MPHTRDCGRGVVVVGVVFNTTQLFRIEYHTAVSVVVGGWVLEGWADLRDVHVR
jgi:hypothetical protein